MPPANTLVRWVNENAFASIVQARPIPPLADRFIIGVAPIDYGPVLLLMPFGFHLTMDTLPSRELRKKPTLSGQRGITPAFGYDAPHPSARGTLTLLNNVLLSTHYAVVRLPAAVHEGLAALRVLPPARRVFPAGGHGVSRFSRTEFLRMPGVSDSAGPGSDSRWRPSPCCLPLALTASAPRIRLISEINTLPAHTPVQRLKCDLTTALAWLGARVARYAFPVRLFHSLLHAGLSRRYPELRSAPASACVYGG